MECIGSEPCSTDQCSDAAQQYGVSRMVCIAHGKDETIDRRHVLLVDDTCCLLLLWGTGFIVFTHRCCGWHAFGGRGRGAGGGQSTASDSVFTVKQLLFTLASVFADLVQSTADPMGTSEGNSVDQGMKITITASVTPAMLKR